MKVDNRHSRFFWDRVGYAMIFSFHVGLTDSVMQRMQFFCQCLFDIFLPPNCQIYYSYIRKKLCK
jgi:hypothetical protein